MNKTKIDWADSTWNPVTGCLHGCEYCYARGIATRFGGKRILKYGQRALLTDPIRIDGKIAPYPYGFMPTFHMYRLGEYEKKEGRVIFVCSMADLFGEWVPDLWIEQVFDACERAPQHTYLFLTKNPKRYNELAALGKLPRKHWYGYTATRQKELWSFEHADECKVQNLFVSIEPMLEEMHPCFSSHCPADWVIIGAETGNRAGKVVPERGWVKEITKTCIEKNIPLLMKESLTPIIGEENMFRELPWDRGTWETEHGQKWLDKYYEE